MKTRIGIYYNGAGRSFWSDRDKKELYDEITAHNLAVGFWSGELIGINDSKIFISICLNACNIELSD